MQDTLNIDTLNAHGGSGSLPEPRLSEGRLKIPVEAPLPATGERRRGRRALARREGDLPSAEDHSLTAGRGKKAGGGDRARSGSRWTAAYRLPTRRPAFFSPKRARDAALLPTAGRWRTRRPRIRRDYPLNLSISVSGGKETNQDSLSNGERSGNSPAPNLPARRGGEKCGVQVADWCRGTVARVLLIVALPLAGVRPMESDGPGVFEPPRSRVVWECSPKRVVYST